MSKDQKKEIPEKAATGKTLQDKDVATEINAPGNLKPKTHFCVGIGASAGGLEALEQFFKSMPSDSGISFVIIQHLSPDYKSLMVELLSKHTSMEVIRAEDGMQIKPNCVYLIPPKKNMTIFHGKLLLSDQNHQHVLNLPIDIFFRSLAEDYCEYAVGVILSGTGSDGTLGIRAIKGNGGMIMAQDDNSAKFDGMPRSAIATGLVDYILPADKMPGELLRFVKHPLTAKQKNDKALTTQDNTLNKILSLIRNQTTVDFTYYKPNTIIRRLERRISINQLESYEGYVALLEQSPKEVNTLYKELLIGVTRFFRDKEGYDVLEEKVIPQLFKGKSNNDPVRLWSVGCSTGEEAYSLAILLKEYMEKHDINHDIKIFATDLDKESIEYGSIGFYTESIVADVSLERLQKHFIKKDKGYQIRESIRKMVIFARHNILKDPPFSKIDLISCRNMLIYLKPVMQRKILSLFHFSLHKEGYLFLGSSETLGDLSKSFSTIHGKWKIYTYKEDLSLDTLGEMLIPNIQKPQAATEFPEHVFRDPNPETGFSDQIFTTILDEFIPPSVIVDENFEIVHICKDVNKYLKLPSGKISFDILSLVRKELSTPVSISIHKALKEKKEIIYKDFKLKEKDEIVHITIKVKPLPEKFKNRTLLFLVFEEKKCTAINEANENNQAIEYDIDQQIKDLELELKYTRENLQATIEELGTSNEELQATNEELISSNEELQSTNEELQSVNEELHTVNSEYQNKIEVLTQLNNDINNLLKNTNIGTVFLDRNFLIRKYTPAVTAAINILEMDIGRPIHHISHNTFYDHFTEDIENVLRTLVPKETEVRGKNNNWFYMRILPYRTQENAVDGVVITFFDITERKKFEEEIERKNNLLISVLDNSPVASTILDKNGSITYANRLAEKVLGLTRDEITQRSFNTPKWKITDIHGKKFPDHELPFYRVKETRGPVFDVVHSIQWPNGSKKVLSINGSPIFDEKRQVDGVICTLLDITQKLKNEEKLKKEHEMLLMVLENSQYAKLMTDRNGALTFANKYALDLFSLNQTHISKGVNFQELNIDACDPLSGFKSIVEKIVKTRKPIHNHKCKIEDSSRNRFDVFLTASPVTDLHKKVTGVFISIDQKTNLIKKTDLLDKQLSIMSNMIPMGIFTLDVHSRIASWNQKAEEISGISAQKVIGTLCTDKRSSAGSDDQPCFLSASHDKPTLCKTLKIKVNQKDYLLTPTSLKVIRDEEGQILGALGCFEAMDRK